MGAAFFIPGCFCNALVAPFDAYASLFNGSALSANTIWGRTRAVCFSLSARFLTIVAAVQRDARRRLRICAPGSDRGPTALGMKTELVCRNTALRQQRRLR